MADPVSIVGLVITIGHIATQLFSYGSAVHGSKAEIKNLAVEVFALKGVLESISTGLEDSLSKARHGTDHATWAAMARMTNETLVAVQKRLKEPKGKLDAAKKAISWPFTKAETDRYLATLERAKSWFLMVLMNDTSDLTNKLYSEMLGLLDTIRDDIGERKAEKQLKDDSEFIRWLAPARSEEDHAKFNKLRVPGSGQWFFDESFESWIDPGAKTKRMLWITGKSGAGKTVLFSSIVEKVREHCLVTGQQGCGFHYCSLDNAGTQQPVNILGSILAQAIETKPEIIDWVRPLQKQDYHLIAQNSLTVPELVELLQKSVDLFDRFFILVDALNETRHHLTITKALLKLVQLSSKVRVLVTSTSDVSPGLGAGSMIISQQMIVPKVNHDIASYVHSRIESEAEFGFFTTKTREVIEWTIMSTANGMFRWAQLNMDHLATLRTGRDIKKALDRMPSTLNEAYAKILERINQSDRDLARQALMWLSFTLRPLTLGELAEAVILNESDRELDEDCRLASPDVLLTICHGLIHRDEYGLKLAHDSIRSFLQSDWIRNSPVAEFALEASSCQKAIMRRCLTYLSFDEFAKGRVSDRLDLRMRFASHPLLIYATTYWPYHAEFSTLAEADEQLILSFFATKTRDKGGSFDSWVQFLMKTTEESIIASTGPLYYAASFDMVSVLKLLLKPGTKVNLEQRGGRFHSTPLFVACWRRNDNAAKILVEAGANPDATDCGSLISCREMAERRELNALVTLMDMRK